MEETKIIYHIDDEDTPYLIRLPIPPEKATLGDFKNELNRPNYKFFFKSVDADFGVVKEEITDDNANLPCCNGRVESGLVSADAEGSVNSDGQQQQQSVDGARGGGGGAAGAGASGSAAGGADDNGCDSCTDSESVYSASQRGDRVAPLRSFNDYKQHAQRINVGRVYNSRHHHHHHHGNQAGGSQSATYESASSMLSSDLDTTSFFDSEDDAESSRFSSATNTTYSMGGGPHGRLSLQNRKRQNRRRRGPPISRTSSFSSITESAFSLNVQTVELDMDAVQFLGISIVGHPAVNGGSGGIYVGSIMRGGAVEREGSIQPGDMLLEVNGVTFENLENDEAVRILREQVQKPGKITLVVAKCWDSRDYLRVPREEPVRPIDPRAWVLHTNAMRQDPSSAGASGVSGGGSSQVTPAASCMGGENLCDSRLTVTAASVSTSSCSLPESERYTAEELMPPLTTRTDLITIVKAMALPDSGLEVRDRTWLKITIPKAFIGSDLVDWLYSRVEGFSERKEARKMALEMLKRGYIRHTVNKVSFSEQCYYVFGDCAGHQPHLHTMLDSAQAPLPTMGMSKLNLMDSGADLGMPQPQPPQQYPMGLMSSQQQQQQQQQQQHQLHHQIPLPPPQGTWGAPPPSYPSLYGTTDSEGLSQYSSVLMQQQQQQQQQQTGMIGGVMPPANSTTVVSDNSDSSSASSRSRSSIPMTIPPTSQSSVGVHPLSQQPQQSQMSHSFASSASGMAPTVSTATVAWKHPAPVWQ